MTPQQNIASWNASLQALSHPAAKRWKAAYRNGEYLLLLDGGVTVCDPGDGYAVWASIAEVIDGFSNGGVK